MLSKAPRKKSTKASRKHKLAKTPIKTTSTDNKATDYIQEAKSIGLILLIALALRATVIEAYVVPTGSMEKTILVGDFLIGNKFIFGMRTPDRIGIPYTTFGFDIPWLRFPAYRKPRNGDVVIFKYPHNPLDKYVKRLIAGPGQTVEIRNRDVFVDGEKYFRPEHLQYVERLPQPQSWNDPNIFPLGNGNKDHYNALRVPMAGDTLSASRDRAILWYVAIMDGHDIRVGGNQIIVNNKPIDYYIVEQDYYFMMGDNRDQSFDSRFWGFVPHNYILGEALFIYFSINLKRFPFISLERLKRVGTVIH